MTPQSPTTNPQPLISLCMIVGNVEEYIDTCLTSFAPIADEIVIVRAIGSQTPDRTCDIAREKFGARIFEYQNAPGHEDWPHVDSFAAARQMSFDMSTGEFRFWCDSDDVLKSGADIIRALAQKGDHDVYIFPYEIFGRGVTVPRERMIRRKAKGRWLYPVHECFAFDETTNGGTDERVIVEHLPKPSKTGSNERNLRILESIAATGMTPGLWFHLHQELRAVGRLEDSVAAATKAITHPDVGRPEKYELLLNLATMTKDRNVAQSYLTAAFAVNPQRREALGLMACCAIDAGRPADALALARQMIATNRPNDWSWNDRGAAYGWLGVDIFQQCLRASGNGDEAERVRRAALAEAGGARISLLHATRGRPHEASKARKMWLDLAEHPETIEHIFAIDEDDDESFALRRFHHVTVPAGGYCVAAWNAAAAASSGDVLIQMSDDWIPPAKWDSLILSRLGDLRTSKVLSVSDGARTDGLLCMAILTRSRYEDQGYLFHPDFKSMYSDNWFTHCAQRDAVIIFAPDLVFEHRHPAFGKGEMDATYARSNAPDLYLEGLKTFERLKAIVTNWTEIEGWFNYADLYMQIAQECADGDVIVEVGCWKGRSVNFLATACKALGKKPRIVVVDAFTGEEGQPQHQGCGYFRAEFERNLAACGNDDLVSILEGDSAAMASAFADGEVFALFLDAAHEYEPVLRDLRAWMPKVRADGILAGHDWQHEPVRRAVQEMIPAARAISASSWIDASRRCEFAPIPDPQSQAQPRTRPLLSILTPAIWSRVGQASALEHAIRNQTGQNAAAVYYEQVEHVTVFDNRARSVGLKRQACLDIARGDYIVFVDDDDKISPGYINQILAAIEATHADVITFDQLAVVNGERAIINFDLANGDNPFTGVPAPLSLDIRHSSFVIPRVKRGAWHVNVWKRELVKDCLFPDSSYGEDLVWSLQARQRVKTHHHIDAVLHEYHHATATTAAPQPSLTSPS